MSTTEVAHEERRVGPVWLARFATSRAARRAKPRPFHSKGGDAYRLGSDCLQAKERKRYLANAASDEYNVPAQGKAARLRSRSR